MARVTVRTLAEALGTSVATVSNAYNRPDQLSPALRARILGKAEELGYAGPDAAARALRSGRAEAVGVVLTEQLSYAFSDPYAIGFLTGLCEVVEQRHISIVLMPLSLDGDELDVTAVRHAKVDALTTFGLSQTHPAVMVAKARGIRLVLFRRQLRPRLPLGCDRRRRRRTTARQPSGFARTPERRRRRGHHSAGGRVVAELADDEIVFVDYASRIRGLRETLSGPIHVVSAGHNATASGGAAGRWLLTQPPDSHRRAERCAGDWRVGGGG